MSSALTICITSEGEEIAIDYDSADKALDDHGLQHLFDQEVITSCTIERGGKRLAGLPFMTWERLTAALAGVPRCDYAHCRCPGCFEIAVSSGTAQPGFCDDCAEAGCDSNMDCRIPTAFWERAQDIAGDRP